MANEKTFIYREMAKLSMTFAEELGVLHRSLMREYIAYKQGDITQKEYLIRVKPLDIEIGKLEMATLQGNLVLQESFLQHALKLKH